MFTHGAAPSTKAPAAAKQRSVWRVGAVLLVLGLAACSSDRIAAPQDSNDWGAGTASHDVSVGGVTRTFLLHVPAQIAQRGKSSAARYPLLVVMHGSSGTGAAIENS